MATTYSTATYTAKASPNTGHGVAGNSVHLHATSGSISTWAINDTINVGYLPRGAVVVSATLKAASQLDSNGSPALTLDLGVVGTLQLWKAAITTVGRTAGASADTTMAAAGVLYKNTSGANQLVVVTVHAAAATAVAGTLEVDLEYYVEDTVASNP
jgi:hypothetical protein